MHAGQTATRDRARVGIGIPHGGHGNLLAEEPGSSNLRPSDGGVGISRWPGEHTDEGARFEHAASWNWSRGLGEVVTAIAHAGMSIDFVHEHAVVACISDTDHLRQRPDGMWEDPLATLPLSYSIKATKSEADR